LGVLLLHGFCGTTATLEGIGDALDAAGFFVTSPLLPGHGTSPEECNETTFADWLDSAQSTFERLKAHCDAVGVVGYSMGGALATAVTAKKVGVEALVLINPFVAPQPPAFVEGVKALIEKGEKFAPAMPRDIALKGVPDYSYTITPLVAAYSLLCALPHVCDALSRVDVPTLLFSSRNDHVVSPMNGDEVVARVQGPLERIWLERSYHSAPVDFDKDLIQATTVAFFESQLRSKKV
jgi:carboxylesterase